MRLIQDSRFALRTLLREPGFAVAAILSLTIGIGVNTTVFTLANALLFRPLPVSHPEEQARVAFGYLADQLKRAYPETNMDREREHGGELLPFKEVAIAFSK